MQTKQDIYAATGALRRSLKDVAEFEFIESVYASDVKGLTWWHTQNEGKVYQGWRDSAHRISSYIRENNISGIFGFSQGAAMAALITALNTQHLKFSIIVSGFTPRAVDCAEVLTTATPIHTPSLHVIGEADVLVDPDRSRDLMKLFLNPKLHSHAGGHFIPSDVGMQNAIKELIAQSL